MPTRDPRVDAYIENAAEFAKPILNHIRKLVHSACPDVEETLKWGMPHFMRNGILCSMAAFKEHCALNFWKGDLIFADGKVSVTQDKGMGQFGRVSQLFELPTDDVMIGYIKEAARLNEAGITAAPRPRSKEKKELEVPQDLMAALKKSKKALTTFEKFSYSHKKDYVEWITEAKRAETRKKRIQTALEWLAKGKPRNWKYQ
jgi:uncharacterized protein YdeI (YjbR/CyaY-like superfamily)